jgi:hypothetical protein
MGANSILLEKGVPGITISLGVGIVVGKGVPGISIGLGVGTSVGKGGSRCYYWPRGRYCCWKRGFQVLLLA